MGIKQSLKFVNYQVRQKIKDFNNIILNRTIPIVLTKLDGRWLSVRELSRRTRKPYSSLTEWVNLMSSLGLLKTKWTNSHTKQITLSDRGKKILSLMEAYLREWYGILDEVDLIDYEDLLNTDENLNKAKWNN